MPPRVLPAADPDGDWFRDDPVLPALLRLYVPEAVAHSAEERLAALGRVAARDLDAWAREADRHRPVLRGPHTVEYDSSYERLRAAAREHLVFTAPWHPFAGLPRAPRVVGFALGYLYAQAESGYYCPACMTDGAAFVLARHAAADLRERYLARLVSRSVADGYEGAMYLTEKGGGSDVGGGTETAATPAKDGSWRLRGEKWFASNCSADVALALGRMPHGAPGTAGLGLFLLPRRLPSGEPNPGLRIERLKDKLGVASMATGEVVLEDAVAYLVRGPPDGFKAMAEMVNLSRLYNAVASVGIARRALREGQRAGLQRESFGKPLADHALFRRGLITLRVDVEAALAFTFDTAAAFDRFAAGDEEAARLLRVLTPCAKAVTAKLAVRAASEACEFLGGVGYTEEYVTPRLLRDAQVLPIWEGTTNVQGLEFLKAVERGGHLEAYMRHARGTLAEASGAARDAAASALDRLESECGGAIGEASALRLLQLAYDAHATGLLARLAAKDGRFAPVARLHAALRLGERDEGERALESAAAVGRDLAYPT